MNRRGWVGVLGVGIGRVWIHGIWVVLDNLSWSEESDLELINLCL